jgi:tRNA-Thr(GGU) m(6)t(6)A37 methyltransferase TsaA
MNGIKIKPVGIIHTGFKTKEEAPMQGAFASQSTGTVEIFTQYQDALKDIETFSHIYLLYCFDRAGEVKLIRPTFFDERPHGVFASRHPCRPNSIGLTVVRLLKRSENILEISGIDVLDQTPLIDIKPYIPRFDCFPDAKEGWLTGKTQSAKPPGRE